MFDHRLLIVTGKGGVGRSAVASAIARSRVARGERVLAIAIDRGAGLATHLGAAALGHAPGPVFPGLSAAIVDPASALDDYVHTRASSLPVGLATRIFRVLAVTVPGVREIVLIGKVWHEAVAGPWDAVVVDAAPAGQIQPILRAPTSISELVPKGPVHDQAQRVAATLADPSFTQLVVVAAPEELPLTEADEINEVADATGISSSRRLVLNRVLSPPPFAAAPARPGPLRDAALLHLAVVAAQRRAAERHTPDVELPLLLGSHSPVDVSTHLASLLTGQS